MSLNVAQRWLLLGYRGLFGELLQPALDPRSVDAEIAPAQLGARIERKGRSTLGSIEEPHNDGVRKTHEPAALDVALRPVPVVDVDLCHARFGRDNLAESEL